MARKPYIDTGQSEPHAIPKRASIPSPGLNWISPKNTKAPGMKTEVKHSRAEYREFHALLFSTSLVSQIVAARYLLQKPPAKIANRDLRQPAPYREYCSVKNWYILC